MSYVEIPRAEFVATMTKAGFVEATMTSELVFERAHRLRSDLVIRVFSGFPKQGERAQRGCGEDAIRVVLVFRIPGSTSGGVGVKKFARVHRTGTVAAVLDRMLTRARAAYEFANTMQRCPMCKGWRYPDSGRCIARCNQAGARSYMDRGHVPPAASLEVAAKHHGLEETERAFGDRGFLPGLGGGGGGGGDS